MKFIVLFISLFSIPAFGCGIQDVQLFFKMNPAYAAGVCSATSSNVATVVSSGEANIIFGGVDEIAEAVVKCQSGDLFTVMIVLEPTTCKVKSSGFTRMDKIIL